MSFGSSSMISNHQRVALLAAALVACSAPAKTPIETPPPVGNLAPRIDPYCPPVPGLGPWHADVFPACPPWPISDFLHVCDPGECPTPCHMHSDIGDDMGTGMYASSWNYVYDDRGRWIGTMPDEEHVAPEDIMTCAYERDTLESCQLHENAAKIERDATKRITRVSIGVESVAITYGAKGEVLSVGESTLRYDERGRIAAFTLAGPKVHPRFAGDYVLERDASGRVVTETGKREVRTFTYDKDNRVVSAVTRLRPWTLSSEQPPKPPGPDVVSTAGSRWGEDDICMECADGAVDPPPKDPAVERAEMLETIEESATATDVVYDGARIVNIASGERGPRRRFRQYVYDCTPAKK